MKRKAGQPESQFGRDVRSLREQACESIADQLRDRSVESVDDAKRFYVDVTFAQSVIRNKVDPVFPDEEDCGEAVSMGTEDTMACGLMVDIDEERLYEYEPTLIPESKLNMTGEKAVVSVAAGGLHSVCLHRDGTVSSWGANDENALGRGEIHEDDLHLIKPMKIKDVIQISAGDNHTTLLDINGKVYVCGMYKDLDSGRFRDLVSPQDKNIKSKNHEYPSKILGLGNKIIAVDAGNSWNCALDEDGSTLYTWGMGNSGQLARSKTMGAKLKDSDFLDPKIVDAKGNEKKNRYKVYDCGKPLMGKFYKEYDEETKTEIDRYDYDLSKIRDKFLTPAPVEWAGGHVPNRQVLHFSCGDLHLLVVAYTKSSNRTQVFSSGNSGYGQLGHGNTKEVHELTPIEALNNMQVSKVAAGNFHSLAISMDGRNLFSWGKIDSGALGLFDEAKTLEYQPTDYIAEPKKVAFPSTLGESRLVDVAAGDTSSFAVTDKGEVYSWGYNENSQTGHYNVPGSNSEVDDHGNKANNLIARPRLLDVITAVNDGLERSERAPTVGRPSRSKKSKQLRAKNCRVTRVSGGGQHSLMVIKRYK